MDFVRRRWISLSVEHIYRKNFSQLTNEPVGQQVVLDLLEVVSRSSEPKYHEICFDNFFTSTRLLQLLSEKGYIAVGTIRKNRTNGASKSMISNHVMK